MGGFLSGRRKGYCSCCSQRYDVRQPCCCSTSHLVKPYENGCATQNGLKNFDSSLKCRQPGSPLSASVSPYILQRWSSKYFDEDGDLAHEFYNEVYPISFGKPSLVRVSSELLRPQGWVEYAHPRLHPDLPYILVELSQTRCCED